MADGAHTHSGAEGDALPFQLGDMLEMLLARLAAAELPVGVRERSAAFAIAARWLETDGKAFHNLRPLLAPVLARTRDERETFFRVFDAMAPSPRPPGPPPEPETIWSQLKSWLGNHRNIVAGLLLAALIALSVVIWELRLKAPAAVEGEGSSSVETAAEPDAPEVIESDDGPAAPAPSPREPQTGNELLDRVLEASRSFDHAPTLKELASELVNDPSALAGTAAQEMSVIRSFIGHTRSVYSVALTGDGRLVTGSYDGTARLWDLETGEELRAFTGHTGGVSSVALTGDGRLVTGSDDRTARLWDLDTGEEIRAFTGHADWVSSVALTGDGRLVTGSGDGTARLWDLKTGEELRAFTGHMGPVNSVAATGDGRLVTGSRDGTARLWDLETGEELRAFTGHTDWVNSVAVTADGRLVTGSRDGTARLWDLETGEELRAFTGHKDWVNSVAVTADGRLVTGSYDGTARLWDLETGEELRAFGHTDGVSSVAATGDGRLVTGSSDETRLWDIPTSQDIYKSWTATSYYERLHDLTGLPLDQPLALFGAGGRDGAIWARVAQALSRIEQPGQGELLAMLKAEADKALAEADPPPAYLAAAALKGAPGSGDLRTVEDWLLSEHGLRVPRAQLARAMALADGDLSLFPTLPWRTPPPNPAAQPAPGWLPWLSLGLPLAFALWFARRLFLKSAYLRRRTPRVPPLHTELVSDVGSRIIYPASLFQRAAQRLLVRTPRSSAHIDIDATVKATLDGGGMMVAPVFAEARLRPAYLVLIERNAMGDQESRRLRQLVSRIEDLVDLDVFYFQTEPSEVESEDGGRRWPIEYLQTSYPDHRLILMGECTGLLDPVDLSASNPARKLMAWERRALLTPVSLAEWGREEFALSQALKMAVGRATPEGLVILAELLGLEGAESEAALDHRGDGLARPLPEIFRQRQQRFLFNTPPDKATVADLVRELRNYLDPAGFEWFAALAVYPAVQWDLTLYLGVELPRRPGGDAAREPLYDEGRLAALTQLPWLRSGRMPNWLRRLLIAHLPKARAQEVRAAIEKAIAAGRLKDQAAAEAIELRIGQEQPREHTEPDRLFEDEVLVDFLAAGKREDLRATKLSEYFDRSFWDSIGLPDLIAGGAAILYAVAGLVLATSLTGAPVHTGGWAPLWLLAVGGAAAVLVWNWRRVGGSLSEGLERAAPVGLGVTLGLGATLLFEFIFDTVVPSIWSNNVNLVLFLAGVMLAAIPALLGGRYLSERLGVRIFAPAAQGWKGRLGLCVRAWACILRIYLAVVAMGSMSSLRKLILIGSG